MENVIKTIDLWTEQHKNHYECFNGCFVDGFDGSSVPFDRYKIVKNCNCEIFVGNKNVNISNKHHAIIFYKESKPIRLIAINKDTDVEKCVNIALSQMFGNVQLKEIYENIGIKSEVINLNEKPVFNQSNPADEIDVGSCDRWNLLFSMLKGSYTESETSYGNFQSDKYEFIPNIKIVYKLKVKKEMFLIEHECAFINSIKTRIIPIQKNSPLTSN